jgi:hypothetical protein
VKTIATKLDDSLAKAVEEKADTLRVSVSEVVRMALQAFLQPQPQSQDTGRLDRVRSPRA